METIVFIVRHAHAEWVPDELRSLSEQGFRDALRVGALLRSEPIQAVYSSPYTRARQTVEPLAQALGLPIVEEWDLRERELGEFPAEMSFDEAVRKTWADFAFSFPGGESSTEAQLRGLGCLQMLTWWVLSRLRFSGLSRSCRARTRWLPSHRFL